MTDDLIAKLRAALAGATPSPWERDQVGAFIKSIRDARGYVFAQVDDDENRELILLLRNHATELLDRLERAELHLVRAEAAEAKVKELDKALAEAKAEIEALHRFRAEKYQLAEVLADRDRRIAELTEEKVKVIANYNALGASAERIRQEGRAEERRAIVVALRKRAEHTLQDEEQYWCQQLAKWIEKLTGEHLRQQPDRTPADDQQRDEQAAEKGDPADLGNLPVRSEGVGEKSGQRDEQRDQQDHGASVGSDPSGVNGAK